jgi:predicted nucleotidyltransferase component of viral defense system
MISEDFITEWKINAPWQRLDMIEQDLIISRALVDLYNNDLIRKNLVFRGGTALNKIYINPPARYSEDIDLVQISSSPIGPLIDGIRKVLKSWLGEPIRKITTRSVKLIYKYQSIEGNTSKLKIEINTTEHLNVLELKQVNYSMDSSWYSGNTIIPTYHLEELMATKIRALHQRRKGQRLI